MTLQQRFPLLLKRSLPMVFGLLFNVLYYLIAIGSAHAERAVPVLPGKRL